MLPLLPALAAAARGGHTPAFFWSSLSDTGLGRSAQHLHEASAADVGPMRRDFGREPTTPVEVGVPRFIDWWRTWRASRPS